MTRREKRHMTPKKYHQTAGGVVVNDNGEFLTLERRVIRDGHLVHEIRLPKGHIEPGETPEETAVREVCEESGYCDLEIVADLGTTRSKYVFKGIEHERDERYFLMRLLRNERRPPQTPPESEESLYTPLWLCPEEAIQRLTYPSERYFAALARDALLRNA